MAQQLDKNYQETTACDGNIQIKIELNVPGTHISGPLLSWPCEGHWFLHLPPASTLQNSASCPPKVLKVLVCFESFIFLGRNTAHVGNHLAVFQDSRMVPSSRVKQSKKTPKDGSYPYTSASNCQHMLNNIPEE
jgi:hypothetical protein